MSKIEEPMNPYAAEDFANAVKEASARLGEDLKKIGEQMTINAEEGELPCPHPVGITLFDFLEGDSTNET